ncbi:MAG TPA: hypothetical protein VMA09_20905 [Candidatus Binataceae bacterium]|nr:hypothetical protein [Candidatus Binataceae bacterium]
MPAAESRPPPAPNRGALWPERNDVELLAELGGDEDSQLMANRIGVRRAILRSYMRRLRDKLECDNLAALRAFAKPLAL